MFRPSRPIIRPFISSLGSGTIETVISGTNSEAALEAAIDNTLRMRVSASSFHFHLNLAVAAVGVYPYFVLDILKKYRFSLLCGHARDPLKFFATLFLHIADARFLNFESRSFGWSALSRFSVTFELAVQILLFLL